MNKKEIKCLIWDLDHTMWDGILAEKDQVSLKTGIPDILKQLDERGILMSIASKNNFEDGWNKLVEFGIDHYFLFPKIGWDAKSTAIESIRSQLNIGIDTIAFIDDQVFEREEVGSCHPEVECIDAAEYLTLLSRRRFTPVFITEDAARRRLMYQVDIQRQVDETQYKGPKEEFLAGLDLNFMITPAGEEDLQRAEELTVRTSQLNATGITYSYEELDRLRKDPDYELLVCELSDRYGSYGKIGLSLIERKADVLIIRMLLMSCRVMSRGVGTVLLQHIMHKAYDQGLKLQADFKATDRNRVMYITYKFAGFKEISNDGQGKIILEADLVSIPGIPLYIKIQTK